MTRLLLRRRALLAALTVAALCSIGAGRAEAQSAGVVRVLYLIPQDRVFRADYAAGVENAMLSLRTWYQGQLDGMTFTLASARPQPCMLPQPSGYYAIDTWTKIFNDAQSCAPVVYGSPTVTWIIYADVVHTCNTPGRIGAGTTGVTIMGRQDLEGLIGAPVVIFDCGEEYSSPIGRYIGGAGHELGHAFGLPHPAECEAGLPSCDGGALMWAGYGLYPNTHFRSDEKVSLTSNPFITSQPPSLTLHIPTVSRPYVGLTWVASAAPTSEYTISASLSPGGTPIAAFPVGQGPSLTVAAPDGTYYATLRATIGGVTVASNEVEVVVGTRRPQAPTTPAVVVSGNTVTLSWSSGGGPVSAYRLEAGTSTGLTDVGVFDLGLNNAISAVNVPPGTYYVRVRARNTSGLSEPSAEISFVVR